MTAALFALLPLFFPAVTADAKAQAPPDTLYPVHITAEPKRCNLLLTTASGQRIKAKTPLRRKLPQGPWQLRISRRGRQTEQLELAITSPTRLHFCLDKRGQIMDCQRTISTWYRPKGLAFRPGTQELWATLLVGPKSLQVFDPTSGENIANIKLAKHGAIELAFSKDGSRAYATQLETARVYEIDANSKKVLRRFKTKGSWSKVVTLSADETSLFVSNWRSHNISEINLETGELTRRLPVSKVPRGLYATVDGKRLYVASYYQGNLDRVELKTGTVTPVFKSGRVLRHIVADESRGLLFISDMKKRTIWQMDLGSEKMSRLTSTSANPNTIALSPDRQLLFVSNRGVNGEDWMDEGPTWGAVQVFSAEDGRLLDAIVAGNQTTGLAVSEDGALLAFSDLLDDKIHIYRIPTSDTLLTGNGGRSKRYRRELKKKNWSPSTVADKKD